MKDLTQRQAEICELTAQGLTDKLIARQLGVSYKTIKTHQLWIRRKLRASNRAHVAVIYRGLAPDSENMQRAAELRCQ